MDLYGYNAGTTSANEARNRVAQGNQSVVEFNKGLDSEVDSLKLAQKGIASDRLSSRNTELGGISATAATKFGLRSVEAKTGAKAAAKAAEATIAAAGPSLETIAANRTAALSARATNRVAVRAGGAAIETSEMGIANLDAATVAGTRLVPAVEEVGAKSAAIAVGETAAKLAKGLGVVGGIATIGLESYKLAEQPGKFKDENWEQQVGQIGSIVGGGLQIVGALTAWTGYGLGVEAAGTALSLGSTALEEAGDEKEQEKTDPAQVKDITDQKRAVAVAQTSGVELGRSN